MTREQKAIRLAELQQQISSYTTDVPLGLLLQIDKLKDELGLSDICDLDDDCLNCGS